MGKIEQSNLRCMADMSYALKTPLKEIQDYSRIIRNDSKDAAIREYAQKIESAVEHLYSLISGNVELAVVNESLPEPEEEYMGDVPCVLVVDDDELILDTAQDILGKYYQVAVAASGMEALSVLHQRKTDLVLMDLMMPQLDGFETMERIRQEPELAAIPVIFLTGDESRDTEIRCFQAGASDFVRKPFVAQVLLERVRRIIDLNHLQNFLSREVVLQTRRAGHLSREIMFALSKAVDAKDHYTNGHSQRVANYSVEIARRMGKSERELEDIYAMGLLHDVGKIGVSEAIINKQSRLTDEEYKEIKTHTTMGYDILKIITEMPGLATGARWHHERYDGRGYPDGLSGTDIPEEARIICVADCYDAMTSKRSYSKVRPQADVRAEIIRCRGSQFDPRMADIMVAMIDDDPEYKMSERPEASDTNKQLELSAEGKQLEASGVKKQENTPDVGKQENAPVANKQLEASDAKKQEDAPVALPQIQGLDLADARLNIPDDEILGKAIRDYYLHMKEKREKLEESYQRLEDDEALDAYRIDVHAVKSSSAMIGLLSFSNSARQLEELAKKKERSVIRTLHVPFMEEWNRIYRELSLFYHESEAQAASGQEGQGKQNIHTDRKTVLVIDDDAVILRTVKNILEKEYNVVIVPSGIKAVGLIRKKNPDIIFLDYEMPVCNGPQTLEMLRSEEAMKGIPVYFLTGTNDKEHIRRIEELNPSGYLLKPLNMEKLKRTIQDAVG